MRLHAINFVVLGGLFLTGYTGTVVAQGQCRMPANGTVQACGTAPGYFRPQPYTANRYLIPQRTAPGSYYAPIGKNQKNWQQYNPRTGYGPVEPNPYGENGHPSPPRVVQHLMVTRVAPAVQRRRNDYR